MNIKQLNQTYAFENESGFLRVIESAGGIPVVEVKNAQASAKISLQGAHLLSWVPQGEDEVIWLSKDARFEPGKSVRGGIPVCWPWFGASEVDTAYPAHGFARTVFWQLSQVKAISADETQIIFRLDTDKITDNKNTQKMWPYSSLLEYIITLGKTLSLELITYNNSSSEIIISEALHTYFNVGDITQTSVKGLDKKTYLDKPDNFKRKIQNSSITVNSEVDRVYLNTTDDVVIENKNRKIKIKKQGSLSTIVWNPWKAVAEKMADLGEGGYLQMLCVESGNAAENSIAVKAGESHRLQVEYTVC